MISLKNKNFINNIKIIESVDEIETINIPTIQRYQEHIKDITDIFAKNYSGSSTLTPTSSTSSTNNTGSSTAGKSRIKASQTQNRKNNLPLSQRKLGTVNSGIGKRNKAPWELSTWEKIKKNWKGIATVAGIIGVTGLGAYGYFKLKDPGKINEKIKILDEKQIKQFITLNKTFLFDINKIINNTIDLQFDSDSFGEQYKSIVGHYELLNKFIIDLKESDVVEEIEKDKNLRELEQIKSYFKDTMRSFIDKNEKRSDLDLNSSNLIRDKKISWNNLIQESSSINTIILEKLLKINKNLISKLNNKNKLNEIAPLVGATARIAAPTMARSIPKLKTLGKLGRVTSGAGKRFKEISFWEKIKDNWKKIAITIGSLGLAGLGTYAAYKGYKDYKGRSIEKLNQTTRITLENEFENTLKKIRTFIKSYKKVAYDFNLIKKCIEQKNFLSFKPELQLIISQYNSLVHIKRALDGIENHQLKNKLISGSDGIYSICNDFKQTNNNRIKLTIEEIETEINSIKETIRFYEKESKKYLDLANLAENEVINNIGNIGSLSIIPKLRIPAMVVSYFAADIYNFSYQFKDIDQGLIANAVNQNGDITPEKLKIYINNNKHKITGIEIQKIMEFLGKRCSLFVDIYTSELEALDTIKVRLNVTFKTLNELILNCDLQNEIKIDDFNIFTTFNMSPIDLSKYKLVPSRYNNNNDNASPSDNISVPPIIGAPPIIGGRSRNIGGGFGGLGIPGSGTIPNIGGGGGKFTREMMP